MTNVAVVGASEKEDRYSYKAMVRLIEKGYNPIPVAPARELILDKKVYTGLGQIPETVDTVTLYINPSRQQPFIDEMVVLKPRRVIFNPGTENPESYSVLEKAGIMVIEACTLVMLSTGSF